MKKLTFLLAIISFGAKAQDNCSYDSSFVPDVNKVMSSEIQNQNGSLTFTLSFTAGDTLMLSDTIYLEPDPMFTVIQQGIFSDFSLLPNQQTSAVCSLSYNSNLPFYPKAININYRKIGKSGDTVWVNNKCIVYFTPYGTTEIWDIHDFYQLPRVWLTEVSPEPQRVYISKSSIPESTRPLPENIQYEWETDYQLKFVAGLPYVIPMKAFHPDSLAYYQHLDSTFSDTTVLNKITLTRRFQGTITGRLGTDYLNDNGDNQNISLEGIRVRLMKRGHFGTFEWDETHTDENGEFTLIYNKLQTFLAGTTVDLQLEIMSENKDKNFKVVNDNKADLVWIGPFNAVVDLGSVGTSFSIDLEDVTLTDEQSQPLKITNWAFKAYKLFETELNQNLHQKQLKISILTNETTSHFDDKDFWQRSLISLSNDDERHETTIWHEWGHFLFYKLNDGLILIGSGGPHSSNQENHFHLALSEGWADGAMCWLDVHYRETDGEFGIRSWEEGTILGKQEKERRNRGHFTGQNGIRNEYHISCALNDLYDPWDANNTNMQNNFGDIAIVGAGVNDNSNTGFEPEVFDDMSLSINTLCQPVKDKVKSIAEYYENLLGRMTTCEEKKRLKKVFDQNRVNLDVTNFNIAEDNFSSDWIGNISSVVETAVLGIPLVSTSFRTDLDLLPSGPQHNYSWSGESSFNLWVSDNLTIENASLNLNSDNSITYGKVIANTSQANSVATYKVCADINITESGNLRIGGISTTANRKALVSINSGTHLRIGGNPSEPSILRINNNSKLTIEVGATLDIFPGSSIILDGSNAIIDIKGTLNVHDGATFTFTGTGGASGYVVFNTLDKSNIILGNNSAIKFVGANNSDRVMEVPSGKVFWPDIFQPSGTISSSFEIQNGLVALGNNAILNIGTPITLNQARFYAEPQFKAHVIYLWGLKPKINGVIIENITHGIQSFNNVGGHPLTMENVTVSGANNALLSEGKGSTLKNFYSNNNPTGITVKASIWPNTFNVPHVEGATTLGTLYQGGFRSSNLVINKANYHHNFAAVNFTGSGNLVLHCGRFHNIPFVSGAPPTGNGITQKGGTLVAADALGYLGGRVSFKDNKNTIVLNTTRPYLNGGYNDLSFISSPTGVNLALRGTLPLYFPLIGSTLKADNNLWEGTNVPTTFCPATSGSSQNYNLSYKIWLATFCVNIPTSPILSAYGFQVSQYNRCVTLPGGWYPVEKGTKTTAMIINTPRFTNTNLQDAVGQVLDGMHNHTVTNYYEVISLWAELLTEPEYALPLSEEDYYYIDLAENKMMECLGMMLTADTTLLLSAPGLAHFETVLGAQDHWINLVQYDTSAFGVSLKNSFNFDKGAVFHLEGENTLAQTQWTAMQLWADDQYVEHTYFWICQLQREAALKACGHNPSSIANLAECGYANSGGNFRMKEALTPDDNLPKAYELKPTPKISKHLTLYPNPATTSVTAELETSQKEFAGINIYTADGRCVYTKNSIRLGLGINKISIPTDSLVPGVYTIVIETRNIKWNEKVIIE